LVEKLMQEHRQMEQAWPPARAVLALTHFASLYGQHIADEERLAFPAARQHASADALTAMSMDMAQRRGQPAR
jgi:hemerythrin-like domain-containing protein